MKIFLWFLGLIVFLFALTVASLPTLISTPRGQKWSVDLINRSIPGHLSVKNLKLSWLGGQKVEGFQLLGEKNEEILRFDSFSTEESLVSLLTGRLYLGQTRLVAPHLNLNRDEDGKLNVEKALGKEEKPKKPRAKRCSRPAFSGDVEIIDGFISLKAPKVDEIVLTNITADLKSPPGSFHLSAKTKQGLEGGDVLIDGRLDEHLHVSAKVSGFPVAALDQFFDSPRISAALGKTLSVDVQLDQTDTGLNLNSRIESPNLTGSVKGFTEEDKFTADPDSQLIFKITPAFFSTLVDSQKGWNLGNKPEVKIHLEELRFPVPCDIVKQIKEIDLKAHLSMERAEISHVDLGHLSFTDFSATLEAHETFNLSYLGQIQGKGDHTEIQGDISYLPKGHLIFSTDMKAFPIEFLSLFFEKSEGLVSTIGPHVDVQVSGTLDNKELKSDFSLASMRGSLKGQLTGNIDKLLHLQAGGHVNLPVGAAKHLGSAPLISLAADLAIKNDHFSIPHVEATLTNEHLSMTAHGNCGSASDPCSIGSLFLSLKGHLTQLMLTTDEGDAVQIRGGSFNAEIDGAKGVATAKAILSASVPDSTINQDLEVSLKASEFTKDGALDLGGAKVTFAGSSHEFPMAVFDIFFGDDVPLPTLLGNSLELKFDGSYIAKHLSLELHAAGTDFSADLAFTLNDTIALQENRPAKIHWEMTPARYTALMRMIGQGQATEYQLYKSASVDLVMHELYCPTKFEGKAGAFLCQSGFSGDLTVGPLQFVQFKSKHQISFTDVAMAIRGTNFSEVIHVEGKGTINSPTVPSAQKSGFSFEANVLELWTKAGKFNKDRLRVKGEMNLDLIPVHEFTGLLPIEEEHKVMVRAILGPLLNARISGDISELAGPLVIDIKSSNFKAILPLQLTRYSITLSKAVEAEITLTDAINEVWLKDINPILITGAWTDQPLKLYLDAENFFIPIRPFIFRGVSIGKGALDLGKLQVRNGGEIQAIMKFLKAKEVSDDGFMEAWFTPIYFSLRDGESYYERFDALFGGNVHIALWGKIDLNKDKVWMTLGISSTTLAQRYNVSGLTSKDMFQVKMRGSTSKLDLDWSSAYTRIGLLITRSTGGQIGNLVGGLLEQILGSLGDEQTPPPTTNPFPWSAQYPDMDTTDGKPTRKSSGVNKLKQLFFP